ncbi:MAG: undecaprenyl-phosphate glucose phosphotransferase [Bacteroidales bacterium]|nr:undecaprenyl-phosphate glucose phosphotransferase [Bacteroidales bacterium]
MKYSRYISLISAFGDLVILNFYFVFGVCYMKGFGKECFGSTSVLFYVFLNLAWLISANIFAAYKTDRQVYKKEILLTYIKTIVFFFFLFLLFFQVVTLNYYQRDEIKYLFVIFFASLLFWQFLLFFILHFYRKLGYNYRNVVIVGYDDKANELKDYFNGNPWLGYRFKGFFTHQKSDKKEVAGTYSELETFIINNSIDELYIMTNAIHHNAYKLISSVISKYPVKIRLVPDLSDFSYMSIKLVDYDMVPVMKIQQGPLSYWHNRMVKRLSDILISIIIVLSVLSWLIPLLLIIDLFSDREGVFFTQHRSGLNNKPFNLIKFRTMKINDTADTRSASENDERITNVGKFLRKTSLDELPQFFNVLAGQMAVVGPRPHMLKHTDEYKALVNKFMIRHSIKPGITGYAQVRGCRGEIKTTRDMKERIKLDISYIENWSLWFDFKIMFITFVHLLKGDKKAY